MKMRNQIFILLGVLLFCSPAQNLWASVIDQRDIDTLKKIYDQEKELKDENIKLQEQIKKLQDTKTYGTVAQSKIDELNKKIAANHDEIHKLHTKHEDIASKIKI